MPKETSLAQLLQKQSGKEDKTLIKKAYLFAEAALKAKNKKWGDVKLKHSLRTAVILNDFGFDSATIAAAMLHDIMADGLAETKQVEEEFGKDMALLVTEYTKILGIETKNVGKIDTSLLSQVILATAKDIRGIFIKMASRLDLLENNYLKDTKELKKRARIAMQVYVPICHKLGLYHLKSQLEDDSFKVLNPTEFKKIVRLVKKTSEQRIEEATTATTDIKNLMKKEKKDVTVEGRAKHIYAIYKKMQEQHRTFEDISDLLGVRIICNSLKECYEVLGIVHSSYEIVPNQFTDYIANPKKNTYRSIHTAVKWKNQTLEVQIRTWEMHYENETGFASHWQYKHYEKDKYFDKKLSWAKQMMDWQRKTKGKEQSIVSSLKMDFGKNRIFVFTPKKQVIVLPEKSTPIDFAYAVHSDLGNKCGKAKVNGKIFSSR